MSSLVLMVAKDLRRRLRTPVGLIVLLIFPLAFAGMVGTAFGPSSGSGSGLPVITILMVDHDEDLLSNALQNATGNEQFSQQFDLVWIEVEDEARRMMDNGEASALLILPENFTTDLLDGKQVTLSLVKNPAESILPQVVEEMAGVLGVFLDTGVRILGEPLKMAGEMFDGVEDDSSLFPDNQALVALTLQAATQIRPISRYVFPPAMVFDTVSENDVALATLLQASPGDTTDDLLRRQATAAGNEELTDAAADDNGFNIFAVLLPMVSLMSILFMGDNGMRDLLAEEKAGTLTRQFASPAGVGRVLAGKIILTLVICSAAMLILAVVGMALGWISTSISLVGSVLQVGAIALAATGMSSFIYGFARSHRAAATFQSALVMGMSMLGGSMVPLSQMPDFLKAMAPYTINYWGIRGLTDLTVRGLGVADVLQEAGVLLLIGLLGMAIGWWRLSRRYALGANA
ncbi:MAG: ABC transporter permease [Acidobacteria bacterium]|nr:ABC transporter permease [Acidobacteriota bacterium]MCZ6649728.1 ABC transporter permease [Acidobacteriota bacterium]